MTVALSNAESSPIETRSPRWLATIARSSDGGRPRLAPSAHSASHAASILATLAGAWSRRGQAGRSAICSGRAAPRRSSGATKA